MCPAMSTIGMRIRRTEDLPVGLSQLSRPLPTPLLLGTTVQPHSLPLAPVRPCTSPRLSPSSGNLVRMALDGEEDASAVVPRQNGHNGDVSHRPPARPRILSLFDEAARHGRPLHVCAPMVRYSKLPFRMLLRDYGVDVLYTPMMLAHEFIRSPIARDSDFTTCAAERPPPTTRDDRRRPHLLIAQFAATTPDEFARAADLIAPWVDGVDLNCGCPQAWALKEGIGCALMADDGVLAGDMVAAAKARLGPDSAVSVSCKIRVHADAARTRRYARNLEAAGADFLTVHGRRRAQRSSTPPDYDAIRDVVEAVAIPVVANGDAYSLVGVREIAARTKAAGVMAARGILENPALFAGYEVVPDECVRRFVAYAVRCPIPFPLVLHHVAEMTARRPGMTKRERRVLMECRDLVDLIDYIDEKYPR